MAIGKFESGGAGEPLSEINTTPLVDVMLVLLVIFIITAPLMTRGIALDLPKSETPAVTIAPETITISITAKGDFFLNKTPVDAQALEAALEAAAQKSKTTPIHLRAERETRYESVVQVMAIVNALGLSQLAFVTDLPKKSQ